MSDAVELAEVPQLFERWLAGRPLADRSQREYARNVRVHCSRLAETPDRDGWARRPADRSPRARSRRPRSGLGVVVSDAPCATPWHPARRRLLTLGRQ